MRCAACVAIAALAAACVQRDSVRLKPPPVGLSPEKRVELFQQLHGVTETSSSAGWRTMQLANGTQIEHPDDMLPALAPDSPAAEHVHAYQRAEHRARAYRMVGLPLALGGVVVLGVGGMAALDSGSKAPIYAGTVLALAGLVVIVMGHGASNDAAHEADLAYVTYNESLAKTLDLCVSGMRIVACDDPNVNIGPPGETAPAAPGNTVPVGSTIDAP